MPASHAYPPYIEGIIFDATGKPAAGGTVEAYVAGSSVPTPLWSTSDPATSLGPVVTIDGAGRAAFRLREGYAYKLRAKDADGALIWERDNVKCPLDGGGVNIPNPMESAGDMIVGGVDGQPERLAPGDEGDALQIVSGVPTYAPATGDHKVLGSSGDNSPDYLDQKLIALAPLSKDVLNAAGNKMVRFQLTKGTDGQALKTYTDGGQLKVGWRDDEDGKVSVDGTDTAGYLEDKVTAGAGISVTKSSGQLVVAATGADTNEVKTSASDDHPGYLQSKVLAGDLIQVEKEQTPDGDGGYTENLRVGLDARGVTAGYVPIADGSNSSAWAAIPTQTGDHKTAVDGADGSPDYLAAKLSAGSGISLTNTGSAVEIAADAQTGDRKSLVTAADTSAGYLADKLVAGTNVTLTTQTDGDGVQTLEISATGGGGGAVDSPLWWQTAFLGGRITPFSASAAFAAYVPGFILPKNIRSFSVMTGGISGTQPADTSLWVAIYNYASSTADRHLLSSFTWDASMAPSNWAEVPLSFNFDSTITIDKSKSYLILIYNNKAFQWTAGPAQSATFADWGSVAFTPTAATMKSPPTNYPYTGWSSQSQFPFIQLNSWSV